MAGRSYGLFWLGSPQLPQIMAVPFPSIGPTTPTTLALDQARFGRTWQPLPQGLVLTGDSDMEISDDDRPLPSSGGSCLQTLPPPHQAAHDFLSSLDSSLFLRPEGEGARPEIQSANEGAAGVGPTTGVSDGPSAPVTVGAMESDSAMEFSDDDRPLPSSASSCL